MDVEGSLIAEVAIQEKSAMADNVVFAIVRARNAVLMVVEELVEAVP